MLSDDLMTWYEQKKWEEFLKNPQEHFEKTNIVNFDSINRQIRVEIISDKLFKKKKLVNIQKRMPELFVLCL